MIKADVYTIDGEKKGKLTLPEEIFGFKPNPTLLAQAVRVYLANQRRARAKTKRRSEVRGSRRKIWRQKGTGRARHGDRFAPIFVGGGVAHGPTGAENYRLKLTKKMKRQALFSSLSSKFGEGKILVIEDLAKIEPKTKKMVAIIKKLLPKEKKILIILPENLENVIRAARNMTEVKLAQASLLNPYQVLSGGQLVMMRESVKVLEETFLKKKPAQKPAKKTDQT